MLHASYNALPAAVILVKGYILRERRRLLDRCALSILLILLNPPPFDCVIVLQ
jgi:hypothetical protein